MKKVDHYEFLQISPNAEWETIHRVYRFLGARYHPDNPVSGDADMFAQLKNAYDVLSDPARRAAYDATFKKEAPRTAPMSTTIDFMDKLEGETNRRLAVLSVLYFRRRANPVAPEVSLAEVETRMGFPRDYLDFTTWYLKKKGYITYADNGDLTLTVEGVDYVETNRVTIPVLNKLLTAGTEPGTADAIHHHLIPDFSASEAPPAERRGSTRDRRIGLPDWRLSPIERRSGATDRRSSGASDRRTNSSNRRVGSARETVNGVNGHGKN